MQKSAWMSYGEKQVQQLETIAAQYKVFLNDGKTERECVTQTVQMAEKAGYVDLQEILSGKKPLQDKIYTTLMGKTIALFHLGETSLEQGMQIVAAHIDSPRLDLKQHPLYEERGMAYFDTHYYGGIKKYQWVTLPLAMHGGVVKMELL